MLGWGLLGWGLFGLGLLGTGCPARAQNGKAVQAVTALPAGQTLPVALSRGLRAGGVSPGTPVIGYVTQRVPLSADTYLPAGAQVLGTVVASSRADGAHAARLSLRFTMLKLHGTDTPLRVKGLAVANFTDVNDTHVPVNGIADRQTPGPANWTTRQIGGDVLMRSGWMGELDNGAMQPVGFADFNGIYAGKRQARVGATLPRALGAFSAEAQGLYGFGEGAVLLVSDDELTVTSPGKLVLRRGDELLLQVLAGDSR